MDINKSKVVIQSTVVSGSVTGGLNLQGNYDPTATSLYPTSSNTIGSVPITKGMFWVVSVNGTINTHPVLVGDAVVALVNGAASNADGDWLLESQPFGGAGAPVYPLNEISYGDGSTPGGTSDPNFTWNASTHTFNATDAFSNGIITDPLNGTSITVSDNTTYFSSVVLTNTYTNIAFIDITNGYSSSAIFQSLFAQMQWTDNNLTYSTVLTTNTSASISYQGATTGGGVILDANQTYISYLGAVASPSEILLTLYSISLSTTDAVNTSTILLSTTNIALASGTSTLGVDGLANAPYILGLTAYASNPLAVAALGANRLYYTDIAGEYTIKITH